MIDFKNKELKFEEKTHTYIVGDKELMSATTFIGQFFSKFDSEIISTKIAKGDKKKKQEILNEWKESRDTGTLVHKQIEEYIKGKKEFKNLHKKSERGINYYNSIRYKFFSKEGNCFYNNTEQQIASLTHELAGTIDLININEGRLLKPRITLTDWKTNKTIKKEGIKKGTGACSHLVDCNFNKYQLQLSLYAYLLEEEYNVIIEELNLVHLKEDGYKVYNCDYMKNTIKEMLLSKNSNKDK